MNPAAATRTLVLVAATLVLVAACSGGGGSSSSPVPATAHAQAAATNAPADAGPADGTGTDGTATGDAGGDVDPCSVFTADRLASVVGQPVHLGDQSMLFGMGCRWDTADGKGGVVIQLIPVHAGYGDLAALGGQQPLDGVGDGATIGPGPFDDAAGDLHTGKLAAALVGEGFASVTVAPPPADDVLIGLLQDLVAATR
jgi:hypothetical protein